MTTTKVSTGKIISPNLLSSHSLPISTWKEKWERQRERLPGNTQCDTTASRACHIAKRPPEGSSRDTCADTCDPWVGLVAVGLRHTGSSSFTERAASGVSEAQDARPDVLVTWLDTCTKWGPDRKGLAQGYRDPAPPWPCLVLYCPGAFRSTPTASLEQWACHSTLSVSTPPSTPGHVSSCTLFSTVCFLRGTFHNCNYAFHYINYSLFLFDMSSPLVCKLHVQDMTSVL